MPTTWNRSPEEFHKIYLANTDAFYRIGSANLAPELDEFMTKCALSLWSRAGGMASAMSRWPTRSIPEAVRSRSGCSGT